MHECLLTVINTVRSVQVYYTKKNCTMIAKYKNKKWVLLY
nr:MAG TPA: hypothetical protein [Caudoviricetes sp.]